jgi:hypothetical protein
MGHLVHAIPLAFIHYNSFTDAKNMSLIDIERQFSDGDGLVNFYIYSFLFRGRF